MAVGSDIADSTGTPNLLASFCIDAASSGFIENALLRFNLTFCSVDCLRAPKNSDATASYSF